jgi:hypothetical protein
LWLFFVEIGRVGGRYLEKLGGFKGKLDTSWKYCGTKLKMKQLESRNKFFSISNLSHSLKNLSLYLLLPLSAPLLTFLIPFCPYGTQFYGYLWTLNQIIPISILLLVLILPFPHSSPRLSVLLWTFANSGNSNSTEVLGRD